MENKTQVVKYDITDAAIAEMKSQYMGLVITDLEDKEEFDAVHNARMVVKGKRVEVDKRRKELKADALAWGKKVQDEANRIFALIEPIESHLKKEENKVEEEQKRKEQEQIASIKSKIEAIRGMALTHEATVDQIESTIRVVQPLIIEPDKFFEFTAEATEAKNDVLDALNLSLETRKRLDKEDAERKAEDERLAAERKKQEEITAKQKAEQDKIDAANRKIAEEKTELEKAKKADQERRDREKNNSRVAALNNVGLLFDGVQFHYDDISVHWTHILGLSDDDFNHTVEQFGKKVQDRKAQAEKEKAEQAERERIEREETEAAEQARQEALKPDKDQIEDYANDLMNLRRPPVGSIEAKKLMGWALEKLTLLSDSIKSKCEEL